MKTGGNWNPDEWPVYFSASNIGTLIYGYKNTRHILVAVNELGNPSDVAELDTFIANGNRVFIDSGVFWLSTQHAKKNGVSMDEALALAPGEIDGFDELYERYVSLLKRIGDSVWGYIEIDQGGRENKIKTRAKLEAEGLRPIPVYHPFNDGWDYFDYLAERYDRICFGNVVQADTQTRKRLLATAWERRRKYPNLWIHLLWLTPSEKNAAYPIPSCDSSTWLSAIRWGGHTAMVANKRCWQTGEGFLYDLEVPPEHVRGSRKARKMAAYESEMLTRTMAVMAKESSDILGLDISGKDMKWKTAIPKSG